MKNALIYIHGFNSASQDERGNILLSKSKLRILTDFCAQNDFRFLAPNLDYLNVDEVIVRLIKLENQLVSNGYEVNYIGTSLGGFFAEYMAMITCTKAIMINPAINPSTTLKRYIGPCQNYANNHEYIWTQENCDAFKPYEEDLLEFPRGEVPRTILLDMGDELLDSSETIRKYEGKVEFHTYEGGSHRFDHLEEALPIIKGSVWWMALPLTD